MNDQLRQQHFKTNASVDTDDFLNKLNHRIDSESSSKRKVGIGFSTLTVAIFLYMFIPMETIYSNENFYTEIDYLEDSNDLDQLDLINIFASHDIELVSNNEEFKKKNILIFLALTVGLDAQDSWKKEVIAKKLEQGKEQREAWVVGTLTEHLDLNTEQAQKFFPLQNEFHNKADGAKKAHQEKLRELRLAAKDDRSKFDVDAAIDSKMRMKDALVKLESKFLQDTKDILTEEQRAKLLFFEERMKANIAKEMKGSKDFDRNKRGAKRFFDSDRKR